MIRPLDRTARFAVAGAVGFAVDAAVLAVLATPIGPFAGRAASFTSAAVTTWLINRRLAFSDRASRRGAAPEYLRYFFVMLVGGAVNLATYAAIVALLGRAPEVLFAGVAVGSVLGMGVNLTLANRLVFRYPRAAASGKESASQRPASRELDSGRPD